MVLAASRILRGSFCGVAFVVFCALMSVCPAPARSAERNLLRNADFSEGRDDGRPADWLVHDQTHEAVFELAEDPETGRGNTFSVTVNQRSERPWDVQLRQTLDQPLAKGTNLQVSFEYRMSADYWFTCYVQQEGGAWQKYIELRIDKPAEEWSTCRFTYRLPKDINAAESSLCFHLAAVQGRVVFRNMSVRVLPEGLDADAVSESDALVIGGDAVDRQWRQEARQRLREHRRGVLTVRVRRGDEPVPDAGVAVDQVGPLLPIGAVVPLDILAPALEVASLRRPDVDPELVEACRQYVLDSGLFTRIIFPDALRWSVFEQLDAEELKTRVAKLAEEGLAVHGRALYTPAFRFAPRHSRQLDTENLRAAVLDHIRAQASAFEPIIPEWTVIDSPLTYHEMYDVTGEGLLKEVFEAAREAAPAARLFLGEDKALTSPAEERLNDFIGLVRWLLDSGTPLDGLAVRMPTGRPYLAPKALESRLARIMEFTDLPIVITGLDVDAPTAETQATRMADMLLLFASHSQVSAVYFSELWAPYAVRPRNALFDDNFEARPALEALTRLLSEEWSTHAQAQTDAEGIVRVEGFTAPYTVTVRHNGETVRRACALEKSGAEITVQLPGE